LGVNLFYGAWLLQDSPERSCRVRGDFLRELSMVSLRSTTHHRVFSANDMRRRYLVINFSSAAVCEGRPHQNESSQLKVKPKPKEACETDEKLLLEPMLYVNPNTHSCSHGLKTLASYAREDDTTQSTLTLTPKLANLGRLSSQNLRGPPRRGEASELQVGQQPPLLEAEQRAPSRKPLPVLQCHLLHMHRPLCSNLCSKDR
jgi:hypothetical protein